MSIDEVVNRREGSILGTRVTRTEDPRLLTGSARYMADLIGVHLDGSPRDTPVLHAVHVPSPVASGRIIAVHTGDAAAVPGVHAVWTASDLAMAPQQGFVPIHADFARPPIADERVRFVGETIAVVFATDRAVAADAAQLVWADIEPDPAVVDCEAALADDAPLIHAHRRDNLALSDTSDSPVNLDVISATVVRGRYVNQRVAVVPMETDGCLAEWDGDHLTLWASTQMPHLLHGQMAAALEMAPDNIRVRTPQVGGGFGGKAGLHVAYVVAAVAAQRLGMPVMWTPWRSEDLLELPHGRGQVQYAEAGFDTDGRLTGFRFHIVGDAGAYPGIGAALPGGTRRMGPGNYAVPAYQCDVAVALTTTTPIGAYRGAGRPEATALVERLMDQAAHELGIDPIELRRRNLLADDVFPHTTPTGNVYDSGAYTTALDTAAAAADYDALRAEQADRRARGDRWQLGIGVACYVEITAGGAGEEYAEVTIHADGTATIVAGTAAHGQGHATSYAMIVSEMTGIAVENISLVDGDTARVPRGGGTGGSRSLQLAGSATLRATEGVIERARELAAAHFEADVADIVVDTATATVGVAGVPSSALGWGDIARLALDAHTDANTSNDANTSDDADVGLAVSDVFAQEGATFPFGAHIAVVEVDTETGRVRPLRHIAVDDCGTVLAPLIVEGQQHGGIASGLGQALYEQVVFDNDGNPLTGNLADYALPSAAEMTSFDTISTQTPSPLNPLGAKGIGEAATIGSTPAIQNAVIDAVAHLGVRHIDMPCTSERVWRAIDESARGEHDPWRAPPAVFARLRAAASATSDVASGDDPDLAGAADGI
jgi:carbon-monoxide dehydrogenase large subunit